MQWPENYVTGKRKAHHTRRRSLKHVFERWGVIQATGNGLKTATNATSKWISTAVDSVNDAYNL